jgi:hypothetical protein
VFFAPYSGTAGPWLLQCASRAQNLVLGLPSYNVCVKQRHPFVVSFAVYWCPEPVLVNHRLSINRRKSEKAGRPISVSVSVSAPGGSARSYCTGGRSHRRAARRRRGRRRRASPPQDTAAHNVTGEVQLIILSEHITVDRFIGVLTCCAPGRFSCTQVASRSIVPIEAPSTVVLCVIAWKSSTCARPDERSQL